MLAISGTLLITSVAAMFAGKVLGYSLSILFGGFVFLGLGGKIAHYKFRDPKITGNSNAWFSGWRHSFLANIFAIAGISMIFLAIYFLLFPIYFSFAYQ